MFSDWIISGTVSFVWMALTASTVHPSANVRPLVHHWSVRLQSVSELRNTLGVHPLEIKRHRRIWILFLDPEPYPLDVLVHPCAEAKIQGIADAGARTLPSLVWRWTPSDAWLDNGIRCMMASSASKSSGTLDTFPQRSSQGQPQNLSMNSKVRGWCASASLARACRRAGTRRKREDVWNLREPLRLGGGIRPEAQEKRLAPFDFQRDSVTSRGIHPGQEHCVRTKGLVQQPTQPHTTEVPARRSASCQLHCAPHWLRSSTNESKHCAHVQSRQKCWSRAIVSM